MTRSLLGFLTFPLLATTSVVACGSNDQRSGEVRAEAGAGGETSSGGSTGGGSTGGSGTGSSKASGGASSVQAREGGACLPALARCGEGESCCPGSVCSTDAAGEQRCLSTCTKSTDCGSLCCLEDEASGQKLCADVSRCPAIECSALGAPCTGVGEACCTDLVCVAWNNPPRAGCEKACNKPSDCDTNCCTPLANSNTSFCAAATACQCAVLDAPCGGSAHCCGGLECTTFDASGTFACKPTCHSASDCATKCCAPLTGTTSVCLGKEWCQ
jgi:hypothetical protein